MLQLVAAQEKASYPEAFVVGAHHVLTMDDHEGDLVLREAWAPDGRLVMLGKYGRRGHVLAIWRPGDPRVAVRPDPLPETVYDEGLQRLFVATTADRVLGDPGARASRARPRPAAPQQ